MVVSLAVTVTDSAAAEIEILGYGLVEQ